jgi:hypothetical protein
MAIVKQAKTDRRLFFENHVKMFKMNENLAAKAEIRGRPSPAWSIAPKVPHFYTETARKRSATVGLCQK